MDNESLRIDKYLWAIRLFKTRSLATEACKAGRIKMNNTPLKASHEVHVGEIYNIVIEQVHKEIEVKALLHNRVSAKQVEDFIVDRTPQEEYERMQMVRQYGFERRDRGVGRPTKRDRREIEDFKYK